MTKTEPEVWLVKNELDQFYTTDDPTDAYDGYTISPLFTEAQLLAAVAEYKQDAERYRFLRANSTQPVEPWSTHSCPESLDDVVDASIAAIRSQEK